jgi:hypothetical protein
VTLEGSGSAAPGSLTDENDENQERTESTQEIRADIEETRYEMGGTLEALGDKLDPGRVMEQAKDNVREATIGRVEDAVESVGATTRGITDMVLETIKRNPIPAAIAGAGLAMLWMNRAQTDGRNVSYRRYSDRYPYDRRSGIAEGAGNAAGSVGEGVGRAAGSVGESVSSVAVSVGEGAQQAAGEVAYRGREAASQIGTQFDRILQSSPLALGAVALGAGAVVGTLVPETEREREVLGDASKQVGTTVRDTVSDAMATVEEKADEAEQAINSRS